jgi:hypothetical protein
MLTSPLPAPLTDDSVRDLERLKKGLEAIHDATIRWNALADEFRYSLGLGMLPEFFPIERAQELDKILGAHQLAVEQQAEPMPDEMQGPFLNRHEEVPA